MFNMVKIKISLCGTSAINNNSFVHSSCSEHVLKYSPRVITDNEDAY